MRGWILCGGAGVCQRREERYVGEGVGLLELLCLCLDRI